MPSAPAFFVDLPLRPATAALACGPTLIVAPHPDDETLGCGGLIALLRQAQVPVWVVLVSDGTMSHPNSRRHPPAARQALREAELREALARLGVADTALTCLARPDGRVAADDAQALEQLAQLLLTKRPATVLTPWRRDPHPDHRATTALVQQAVARLPTPPRLLEYVVWAWERASPTDVPQPGEVQGWRLDISPVLAQKQHALAAHASQLPGGPIDDDPTGFYLAPSMLAHFAQPFETYLEAVAGEEPV
ncbi:PIG-L family deacetylase [Hymenobacter sp. J193]|uniref:PIG-L deacetylase family protein n=1 Tax=Hymenobacter sp. J193 TaxID=2898429 RepID=UPI00215078B0|nr:PIG-L deacetylase family protein [Hymenobacter sp. J193]MCR5887398.1 PIG-L family deacetylase [Hymenobacter sp. J193]